MNYEEMIEDDVDSVIEPTEEELAPEPEIQPAKSPWRAFILTGFLAGLFGASAGGYAAYEGLQRFAPKPVPSAEVDLSSVESRLEAFGARISEAENGLLDVKIPEQEPVDLSGLETRLAELEAAPRPEIDPAALSALQDAQADGFEWPDQSAVESRIAALETSVEALPETNVPPDLLERLSALEAELEALQQIESADSLNETQLSELNSRISALENQPAPEPVIERVSILAFPKAQLIQAVEDNQTGGIVEKTLSRHVRVKNPNDPLTLIDGIETDLSEGRLTDAAKKFERLPAPVRSAGQAWYESVKASL